MIAQNYQHVDKVVAAYPTSFQSIEAFGNRIEKDFTKDADKVRAAYYWIATHISYDFKKLETGRSSYPRIEIKNYNDEEEYHYKYRKIYASYVLTYKTGICEGYSQLLFYVCEYLGIEANVIKGNTKKHVNEINVIPRTTSHAWNAVYFNEKWNLIDATWSTGNTTYTRNRFDFDDTYYCISPEKMILNHFPEKTKWQLLKKRVLKKDFYAQPMVYSKCLALDIILDPKIKGTIKAKTNGFITLRFKKIDTTQKYYYTFVRDKYSTEVLINKIGEEYIAKIPFEGIKKDRLRFITDETAILGFKIIPTR